MLQLAQLIALIACAPAPAPAEVTPTVRLPVAEARLDPWVERYAFVGADALPDEQALQQLPIRPDARVARRTSEAFRCGNSARGRPARRTQAVRWDGDGLQVGPSFVDRRASVPRPRVALPPQVTCRASEVLDVGGEVVARCPDGRVVVAGGGSVRAIADDVEDIAAEGDFALLMGSELRRWSAAGGLEALGSARRAVLGPGGRVAAWGGDWLETWTPGGHAVVRHFGAAAVSWSDDGAWLVLSSRPQVAVVRPGEAPLPGWASEPRQVEVSVAGPWVVDSRSDAIRVWDLESAALVEVLEERIHRVALSPDGRTLASVTAGRLTLRDLPNGAGRAVGVACAAVAWRPDGRALTCLAHDLTAVEVELDGRHTALRAEDRPLSAVASGRSVRLVSGAAEAEVHGGRSAAVAPNGSAVAVATEGGSLLRIPRTLRRPWTVVDEGPGIEVIAWTADGIVVRDRASGDHRLVDGSGGSRPLRGEPVGAADGRVAYMDDGSLRIEAAP